MARKKKQQQLLGDYLEEWIDTFKVGAVREITLNKYRMTLKRLREIAPELTLEEMNRRSYQHIINEYAKTHEKQTVIDFHHQLKGAILDAVDEGLIDTNPTRKITIKGKEPRKKKIKFLSVDECKKLVSELDLTNPIFTNETYTHKGKEVERINYDWLILLCLKTGIRFSEALGLTPSDFDFQKRLLNVDKTWDYKSEEGGFQPTKNESSVRKISIDWQTAAQFAPLIKGLEVDKPIFVKGRIFNSTINNQLKNRCVNAGVSIITVHSLRHTHASVLLFNGISLPSIAKRLGHATVTTTQETYIHLIKELETEDDNKIMMSLANLA